MNISKVASPVQLLGMTRIQSRSSSGSPSLPLRRTRIEQRIQDVQPIRCYSRTQLMAWRHSLSMANEQCLPESPATAGNPFHSSDREDLGFHGAGFYAECFPPLAWPRPSSEIEAIRIWHAALLFGSVPRPEPNPATDSRGAQRKDFMRNHVSCGLKHVIGSSRCLRQGRESMAIGPLCRLSIPKRNRQ